MTTITSTPTPTTAHTILRADGFSCPSCVAKIEKQIGRLAGVTAVTVFFSSARIEVDHDPAVVSTDALIAAVGKAGYTARLAAF
ncbi:MULTISPECIES: heavy-metal-associated domain-containing protein [Cryobacterium]|uniref:Copper chaperone n=1 Tax=Cryobacterium breve TaxID=1259258 RepID=A0ABY2IYN0_9MICO|nr:MULTISPECIES: heavy-metal-associated domain-containing protein [Cryobacterium]TFC93902.1 copper chaperone [Cryobacterium sp. TmT3-12]TFC97640.1 copper chaperone [Cryobacterium breve]